MLKKIKIIFSLLILVFILFGCSRSNKKYTVLFYSNNTLFDRIETESGNNITLPKPKKNGYIFEGWYTGYSSNDKEFTINDVVTEDIQLFAIWKPKVFEISFESNEGTNVDSISQDYNILITKPKDPTKAGYVFDGWYRDENFTEKYTFSRMPAENIKLYAKWILAYEYEILNDEVTIIKYIGIDSIVTIPNMIAGYPVTRIGAYSFAGCKVLTSVIISEGVTSIDQGAFRNCTSLTSVILPQGLTNLDISVFEFCQSLTSINIPNGITTLESNLFAFCISLTSVTLPEGLTTIDIGAFQRCTSLVNIIIPEGVKYIESGAFMYCFSLSNINIPKGVKNIGSDAFLECTSLSNIILPEGITNIKESTFKGCSSLLTITIPDKVTTIGKEAFANCTSLTSIIIPETVTNLSKDVFKRCNSLTIYCKVKSQPLTWDIDWNPDHRTVIWEYVTE